MNPVSGRHGDAWADNAPVCASVADELDRIRELMEDVGVQLCGDPQIVRAHLDVLQAIDEISQRHENLARTLRARDMSEAAEDITLESLRIRMKAAIADYRAGLFAHAGGATR